MHYDWLLDKGSLANQIAEIGYQTLVLATRTSEWRGQNACALCRKRRMKQVEAELFESKSYPLCNCLQLDGQTRDGRQQNLEALVVVGFGQGPLQQRRRNGTTPAIISGNSSRPTALSMVCNADVSMTVPMGAASLQGGVQYAEIVISDKNNHSSDDAIAKIEEGNGHGHGHGDNSGERPAQSVWLLAYCFVGIMVSFTLNGVVLEKMTTHRVLPELSLTFVFCLFYSAVALVLRFINKEKPSTMPQSKLMVVGLLAFLSTISSMVALRYVTFITRILGKSCKSIPVMLVGIFLGKSYAIKKYVSVLVLSIGVAVFLVGTAHEKQHRASQTNEEPHKPHNVEGHTPNIFLGFSLLLASLLFDGATGALEDRFLEKYHIGAFDLMYVVNIWKALFAAIGMVFMGELPTFVEKAVPAIPQLFLLSATGALGQAFIFFTISKFGALTTSIIGTCRKVLSIVLSVILFGHVLSLEQSIGLAVAFIGIGLNWVRIQACESKKSKKEPVAKDADAEELLEASDETVDSEDSEEELSPTNKGSLLHKNPREEILQQKDIERGLELVNVWHRNHDHSPAPESNRDVAV